MLSRNFLFRKSPDVLTNRCLAESGGSMTDVPALNASRRDWTSGYWRAEPTVPVCSRAPEHAALTVPG